MNAHMPGMTLDVATPKHLGIARSKFSEQHVSHLFISISSTLWKTEITSAAIVLFLNVKGHTSQLVPTDTKWVGHTQMTSARIHREVTAVNTVFLNWSRHGWT